MVVLVVVKLVLIIGFSKSIKHVQFGGKLESEVRLGVEGLGWYLPSRWVVSFEYESDNPIDEFILSFWNLKKFKKIFWIFFSQETFLSSNYFS